MAVKDSDLKILTWNLAKGIGDLEEIAKRIEQADIDLCCFQETNGKVEEAIGARFNPRVIHSDEFPLPSSGESTLDSPWKLIVPSGKQGWIRNCILTRLSISNVRRIDLPYEARDALLCQVELSKNKKGKTTCSVINVHLTSGREKTKEREEQLQCLLDQLDLDMSYLILGDYNLARDEHEWPPKNFQTFPLVDTYCHTNPVNQDQKWHFHHPFDRCLYRGFLQIGGEPILLGHDFRASDHFGVIYPISLNRKGTGAMKIPLSEPNKSKESKETPSEKRSQSNRSNPKVENKSTDGVVKRPLSSREKRDKPSEKDKTESDKKVEKEKKTKPVLVIPLDGTSHSGSTAVIHPVLPIVHSAPLESIARPSTFTPSLFQPLPISHSISHQVSHPASTVYPVQPIYHTPVTPVGQTIPINSIVAPVLIGPPKKERHSNQLGTLVFDDKPLDPRKIKKKN